MPHITILRIRYAAIIIFIIFCPIAVSAEPRPNILLVLSDDHSAPHLGCYGSPNVITPHLDAFAARGMRVDRAYTTAPQCAPSRGSIFAGRSPVAVDIARFTQPARCETVGVSDRLREHGYCAGIDGRHHHLDGRRSISDELHVEATLPEAGLKYFPERFDNIRILATSGEENLAKLPGRFGEPLDTRNESARWMVRESDFLLLPSGKILHNEFG